MESQARKCRVNVGKARESRRNGTGSHAHSKSPRGPLLQSAKPRALLPVWRSRAAPGIEIRANHILVGRAKPPLASAIEDYRRCAHHVTCAHPIRRIAPHRRKVISRLHPSRQAPIQQTCRGSRLVAGLSPSQVRQGLCISPVRCLIRHFHRVDGPDGNHCRSLIRVDLRKRQTRDRDRSNYQNDRDHDQHLNQGKSRLTLHPPSLPRETSTHKTENGRRETTCAKKKFIGTVWGRVGACPDRTRGNPDRPSNARLPQPVRRPTLPKYPETATRAGTSVTLTLLYRNPILRT